MKFLKVFFLFLFISTLLFSSINTLKEVEVAKDELRLHFSNTYDKKQIKFFTLTKPFRHVFDLKNTCLPRNGIVSRFGQSIQIEQYRPDIVRIIIKNDKPYKCIPYKPISSGTAYHIPLMGKNKVLTVESYQKPEKEKQAFKTFSNSHKNEPIVIDAGHGGHDGGATGGGKREKDLVLQIAKKLENQLRKQGYPVYMTRDKDKSLTLPQRTKIADQKKAVVFLSIHANSVPKKKQNKIHGVETFFLQNTRDERSQRIAEKENKSVLKGSDKLSRNIILNSVLSGPKIVQSNKLAIDVHRRIMTNLCQRYQGVKDGGVRHAPFWVLVGASRPSILIEVGYISHPVERKKLFTPRYQELIAKGIAEGVDRYLANRRKEIDF